LRYDFFIGCLLVSGALLWNSPAAQVTVENTISTDSVDIFSEGQSEGKSPTIAIAASLILPGSGHQYLERNRSALAYFSAEAIAIFALVFCDHYAKKFALDATGYAWVHAGAQGTVTSDANDTYWKAVGRFMDTQEYNNIMDLNRTPEKKISLPGQIWHWDDKSSQDAYNNLRASSRSYHVASSFFIGAMVLNRVIAFIDIRNESRNRGIKRTGFAPVTITPILSGSLHSIDLSFRGSF
jgi:hypothetical protein